MAVGGRGGRTVDDDFDLTAFVDHGDHGAGRVYTSVQRPRLAYLDLLAPTGELMREWRVDGAAVPSLEAAEAALGMAFVLSPDERLMLDRLGPDWMESNGLLGVTGLESILPDTPQSRRSAALSALTEKGLAEWRDRRVRRRPIP